MLSGTLFHKDVSIYSLFEELADKLNQKIEKRERLVKASRDVTYQSKKAIYLLHRAADEDLFSICSSAKEQLENIRQLICKLLLPELSAEEYFRFHSVFTIALQEYTEARLFLSYLSEGRALTLDEINAEISQQWQSLLENSEEEVIDLVIHFISVQDYILGMIDVSGELMRYCINCSSRNESKKAFEVESFLRQLSAEIKYLAVYMSHSNDNLENKLQAMRINVQKVENACYQLYVRHMEFHSKQDE
ncbi:Translin-associated protein X [Galdieria sulphuraria]|uniref:Translin family protein isoform 1 n=1 Tax=Galdieria sulphuraria TaxID=130081 RepID=M2Y247_GALSU|nr:translin family protein isoform 1 [Galdieria sulphuraria]EME29879.1 translin family protein isoform 1 [Galdieria sulphuraria]GJD11923.1 Translin-associated protein X [Galdieria sulphuraria]|eukprot:XP_005706399.1 translin family protein isoform 1 [Galdieria sulphuraria]